MAISYVGGKVVGFPGRTTTNAITLTDLTGGSDTAPRAGDFVLVYYGVSSTTSRAITVDSSYTNLTKLTASDTYTSNLAVGYKFMGATPDTSVSVSQTFSLDDAGVVIVHVFRDVDATTPLDVTSVANTTANTAICNPNAITPVTAGSWVVAGGVGALNVTNRGYTSSDLTSFRTVAGNDVNCAVAGAGLNTTWTSGAVDPAAFGSSITDSTTFSYCAYTIALRASPDTTAYPTGVSATGASGAVYVPGAIGYVGGTALGFPGTTSTTNVSLTSLTGGFGTAPEENDLVLVYYGVAAQGIADALNISVGSSFTNLSGGNAQFADGTTFDTNMATGYKIMGSTPDTSVTLSQTFNVQNAGAAVVHVFRGVDTTTPLDVTSTTASASGTLLANPPAITPVTAGAVIVAAGAGASNRAAAFYSSSSLSSFRVASADDTNDIAVGAGLFLTWTSGSYDPSAFTFSTSDATSASNVSRTIALRPAPAVSPDITVSVTGVSATGAVGTAVAVGDATADATGVSGAGEVGTVTVTTGSAVDVTADATGVSGAGEVGTVTVQISVDATADATGVSATGSVGTATVTGDATATATGVSGTGAVGTVTAVVPIDVTATATGVSATGAVGDATTATGAVFEPTGVSATGGTGQATVTGDGTTDTTGVGATGSVGDVVVVPSIEVPTTGVSATGSVGSTTVTISQVVSVAGVSATGRIGRVIVWGLQQAATETWVGQSKDGATWAPQAPTSKTWS